MVDCEICTQPYDSPLAAAECADFDLAEDAEHRAAARAATRRLRQGRVPDDAA